jgi:hypothetical protein
LIDFGLGCALDALRRGGMPKGAIPAGPDPYFCRAPSRFCRSILDRVPGGRWGARVALAALLMVLFVMTGCVRQAPPAPAVQRSTPPPWSAPRDAVSYMAAAGLESQPLGSTENARVVDRRISVDGLPVEVPAYIGIDRVRALHAAAHTHDASGKMWLEGGDTGEITLGQFFTLWGVRFDDHCLGSACGDLVVKIDRVISTAPRGVRIAAGHTINITAWS